MTGDHSATAVLKVGGSLCELPDLARRLTTLVESQASAGVLLIPGGGASADVVRNWQPAHGLSEPAAHRLAIEAMRLNARLLEELLDCGQLIRSRQEVTECFDSGRTAVVDPVSILADIDRHTGERLPVGWHVTSDSVAAWIAIHWRVDRLVLVKSIDCPDSLLDAASTTAVDPYFAKLAPRIRQVDWCNLRESPTVIHRLCGPCVPMRQRGRS